MVQEATQSPESEHEPSALAKVLAPIGATLQTLWLLLSSLTRLTVRWLSRCPATAVLTVALMIASASYWVWRGQFQALEADPSSPHWWAILSSVGAVPGNFIATAVLGIIVMIVAGGAAERHLGTRAWIAAAAAGQIVGVAATWLTLVGRADRQDRLKARELARAS
ncbi:MAG: hypothetical protein HXM38_06270, partial [Isoptericola variabilis]|nr:hypothetical protein [Isoptericola variabilis]